MCLGLRSFASELPSCCRIPVIFSTRLLLCLRAADSSEDDRNLGSTVPFISLISFSRARSSLYPPVVGSSSSSGYSKSPDAWILLRLAPSIDLSLTLAPGRLGTSLLQRDLKGWANLSETDRTMLLWLRAPSSTLSVVHMIPPTAEISFTAKSLGFTLSSSPATALRSSRLCEGNFAHEAGGVLEFL